MEVNTAELTRELKELIAALDRRVPRVEHSGEAAIARDAAALRAKAFDRLAEFATSPAARPQPDCGDPAQIPLVTMRRTPFPATPSDVVALSVPEFTCELDLNGSVSLDVVCRRFLEDADRAVVWFIRFRALTALRERRDVAQWMRSDPWYAHRACELAASFELNEAWEFDAERFRSAVESAAREPSRTVET